MRLILSRFAQMLFVLWVVATLLFFMFRLMPGDPSAAYIDSTFTEEQITQLRRTFGLDRPLHEQYAIYLQNLLIGEFGESFHQRRPVLERGDFVIAPLHLARVDDWYQMTMPQRLFLLQIHHAWQLPVAIDFDRYSLSADGIAPNENPQVIVPGLPLTGDHPMHPFIIDDDGHLFIDLGSATNSCQLQNRMPNSPGHQPCTELEARAGNCGYL